MTPPSELNPLVIIFGAGVGLINILGGLVLAMSLAQLRQIRRDIKSVVDHFNDSGGVPGIFTRLSKVEGDIKLLQAGTMNKELLVEKLETIKQQNANLEAQARELSAKQAETLGRVSQVERNTRSGKWPSGGPEGK